jgi:hypothetical protein
MITRLACEHLGIQYPFEKQDGFQPELFDSDE